MKLSNLLKKNKDGIWIPFEDTGFEVKVAYYGRAEMQALYKQSVVKRIDTRSLKTEEKIDEKAFREFYADMVIQDWRGLTLEALNKFVPLDADLPEEVKAPGWTLECTAENKIMLIESSVVFDQWLQSNSSDVEKFNAANKEAATKN